MRIPPYVDTRSARPRSERAERVSELIRREIGRSRREALIRTVKEAAPYEERLDPDHLAALVELEISQW